MRKSRRLVIPMAVFALLAGGGLAAGLTLVANAQTTQTFCDSSATQPISCTTDSETINTPTAITLVVDLMTGDGASTPDQDVVVTWDGDCAQGSNETLISSPTPPTLEPITTSAEVTVNVPLPYTTPDFCDITAGATLETSTGSTSTSGSFQLNMEYTPSASSSTSAASGPEISGYDGKCLDDTGNSTADRTKIQLWTCNGDGAQDWTLSSSGELTHNGDCANDKGSGGNNSKVILWTCNGAANEKWTLESNGELISNVTGHGILCLDDPGYSKSNGTQLIVYACHNGSNQHWSVTS